MAGLCLRLCRRGLAAVGARQGGARGAGHPARSKAAGAWRAAVGVFDAAQPAARARMGGLL
jgi:hypothetical protein